MIKSAIAIAAVVAAAGATQALTQTHTQSDTFNGIPNFSGEFLFDEFNAADFGNPADITLIQVEIIATAAISGGILELDNDGIDPAIIPTAELGASVALSSDSIAALALPSVSPTTSDSFNLAGNNGDSGTFDPQPLTEPDYAQLLGENVSDSDNSIFNQPLAALFEGNGQFDVDYESLAIFDFGGVGGVSFGGTPVTVDLTVEVIYTYEIIPTPGTAALLGVAGLAAARRRRA